MTESFKYTHLMILEERMSVSLTENDNYKILCKTNNSSKFKILRILEANPKAASIYHESFQQFLGLPIHVFIVSKLDISSLNAEPKIDQENCQNESYASSNAT